MEAKDIKLGDEVFHKVRKYRGTVIAIQERLEGQPLFRVMPRDHSIPENWIEASFLSPWQPPQPPQEPKKPRYGY